MIEFYCEGCGVHALSFGNEHATHGLCYVCCWLVEHVPTAKLMETRRRMEPGGWVPERQLRGLEG